MAPTAFLALLAAFASFPLAGATPILTLDAIDVEVGETVNKRTDLHPTGPLLHCSDSDPLVQTRAYVDSFTPSAPCGARCFNLLPCLSGVVTDYCMYFEAGQDKLRYSSTQRYTLSICCTNDKDPVTCLPLTVTVVPNTPPLFNSATLNDAVTINGANTPPGGTVYNVSASDPVDNDPIFYSMTTSPNTPYMDIGYANGQIRATNDLRFMCLETDMVKAAVTISDPYHSPIGPMNIAITVNPSNKAPYISNLDTVVTVDENVGTKFTVLAFNVADPNKDKPLNFHMWSASDAGMEQYYLETSASGAILKTRINPNYERPDTQSVKLYVDIDDGYCRGNHTYELTVNINDINEQVECLPSKIQNLEAYEGNLNIVPGFDIYDPDINDVHTFTMLSGSNLFNVDPTSGDIFSPSEIDIDRKTRFKPYTFSIKVTDKGGLTATCSVSIDIYDANDQAPYFVPNPYVFSATECTEPGTKIGVVTGMDYDSDFNQNDKLYYGGGGGKMAVMSKGTVVLTQKCVDGETFTGSATISDEGIYPGPLQGKPVTISMTCGPCPPPTPAPTPKPVVTTTTTVKTTRTTTGTTPTIPTTTPRNVTFSVGDSGTTDLLSWLIPAIIGGLIWLALTAFLIYRYCCPCRNPFANLCKRKPRLPKTPKPPKAPKKPKKPATPKRIQVVPPPAPPPPPPPAPKPATPIPPPTPPKPQEPYLFGFWKTFYTDQDMIDKETKAVKPTAVENMPAEAVNPRGNAEPPPNLKLAHS